MFPITGEALLGSAIRLLGQAGQGSLGAGCFVVARILTALLNCKLLTCCIAFMAFGL